MQRRKTSHTGNVDGIIDGFWEKLVPMWNRVRAHIRDTATQKHAITIEQFHLLRHIRRGAFSVRDLAQAKHTSRPAISQGVEALVQHGLVLRVQNTEDRRFVHLSLTPLGDALLDAIFQETREWMRSKLLQLSSEDLQTIDLSFELLASAFADQGPIVINE